MEDGIRQWEFASLQLFNGWHEVADVEIIEEIREVPNVCETLCKRCASVCVQRHSNGRNH